MDPSWDIGISQQNNKVVFPDVLRTETNKNQESWIHGPQNCDRLSSPFLATSKHQPLTAPVGLDFGKKTTVDSEYLHVFLL